MIGWLAARPANVTAVATSGSLMNRNNHSSTLGKQATGEGA